MSKMLLVLMVLPVSMMVLVWMFEVLLVATLLVSMFPMLLVSKMVWLLSLDVAGADVASVGETSTS
jgi:hypothetical protein